MLRVGRLSINRDARTAHVDGQPLQLTRLEFDLLQTLAGQPQKAFGRDDLSREVWGCDPVAERPAGAPSCYGTVTPRTNFAPTLQQVARQRPDTPPGARRSAR